MEELGISLKNQKKLKKKSRTKGKSSFTSILTCHQRRTQRKESVAWARKTPVGSFQEEKHMLTTGFWRKDFWHLCYVFPYIYIHNSIMHTDIRNTKVSKAHIDRDYLGSSTDSFEINLYVHLFHLFSFIPINCCVFFLNNNKTTGVFSRIILSVGLFPITCSYSQCLVSKCHQLSTLLFGWILLPFQPDKTISDWVQKILLVYTKYLVIIVKWNHSFLCYKI